MIRKKVYWSIVIVVIVVLLMNFRREILQLFGR